MADRTSTQPDKAEVAEMHMDQQIPQQVSHESLVNRAPRSTESAITINPGPNEATSSVAEDPAEAARRAALRRSGAEFFDRALQSSSQGQDPFQAPTSVAPTGSRQLRGGGGGGRLDPDVEAFGAAFEGSKAYVYMALYAACQAVGLVLMKGSLHSMKTPAVLTFLHCLFVVGALRLAASYDVITLQPLSVAGLKGGSVRATLTGAQLLLTFSALLHGSVNLVLCWLTLAPLLAEVIASFIHTRKLPQKEVSLALQVAMGAAVLEWVCDGHKTLIGLVVLLLLMLARGGGEWAWRALQADPSIGGRVTDFQVQSVVREVADEEERLPPPDLAFYQHALPAVPVLLLGFCCLEGKEIVDHELSVPAVTVMLLSCAAYTVVVGCQLLLEGRVDGQMKLQLRAAALAGAIAFNYLEQSHKVTQLTVFLTLASVGGSLAATWLQRQASATRTGLR